MISAMIGAILGLAVVGWIIWKAYRASPCSQLKPPELESPKLSPLARGIIWSLENEPKKWERDTSDPTILCHRYENLAISPSWLGAVWIRPEALKNELSGADHFALYEALQQRAERAAKEVARPVKEAFEKLGCPQPEQDDQVK